MLNPSRLYSFLDAKNGFTLHFLDAQKLVEDLAITHHLTGLGFAYFREMVLTTIPLISFLKPGESLGIYLDSQEPYFRLKIETSYSGHVRTLLLPEDFSQFPIQLTGQARVTKQFPHGHAPYTSVVQFKDTPGHAVINQVLIGSYQSNASTLVSEAADQSLILCKLPPLNVDTHLTDESANLQEFLKKNRSFFHNIFDEHYNDVDHIVRSIEKSDFAYLSSRQIEIFCPCSKERMIDNLSMIYARDPEDLFAGEDTLETKCDYCKKIYSISRIDLETSGFKGPIN